MREVEFNGKKLLQMRVTDGGAMFLGSYVLKLFLQVAVVIVLAVTDVPSTFSATMAYVCIVTACNELAFLLTPLAYGKIKGYDTVRNMGLGGRFDPWSLLLALPLTVALICMGGPLAQGFTALVQLIGYDISSATSVTPTNAGELIAALIVVAALPAAAEEYLFRGNIARALSSKGYVFAVFVSAALFALMHGSPLQLVHQFFLGVACAILFFATRSLWPPIVLHFVNNAIAIVLAYLEYTGAVSAVMEPWQYAVMCIVGAAASAGLLAAVIFSSRVHADKTDPGAQASDAKGLGQTLKTLYETSDMREFAQEELRALDSELASAKNEQAAQVILDDRRERARKDKLKDRRALIYSFGFTIVIWIVNFVMNVVGVV